MKLMLVKLGKAFNVLKSDGLWRGAGRLAGYFRGMFRRVGSGDILFVTGGVGDSARYRVHHVAEELSLHGFRCAFTIQDNPFLASYADKFKIFIFHRTVLTPGVSKLVEKIKDQSKEIIFEADDLLFDPKYASQVDYFKNINELEKSAYRNGLGAEILNDPYVKICTTTTNYLAEALTLRGKQVFVVPNKLSEHDLRDLADIEKGKFYLEDETIKLGYFSGTLSHNKDFAAISDVLVSLMGQYPTIKLVLVGPLEIEEKFARFKNRIEKLPYVSRKKHFQNLSRIDINLAPLEIGNPFCEAKSELKWFEAAAVGVPTVAAATRTFREAICDGVDGLVANGSDEWAEKLERLIVDGYLRKQMGAAAQEKAMIKHANKNSHNDEYYGYLKNRITELDNYQYGYQQNRD